VASMRKTSVVVMAAVACLNLGLWVSCNGPEPVAPSWTGTIKGVSFSPYREGQDPTAARHPSVAEIEADLRLLTDTVAGVRTYSVRNGLEMVPVLAERHGLSVTVGAWLNGSPAHDELEIEALIAAVERSPAIKRVLVGNEAVLRGEVTAAQLAVYLQRVRAAIDVPVSTAEPWHVWLKHPELAASVDYIAIHVLPYWEKVEIDQAVPWVLERYRQITAAFPGQPVLLAEVGWPSAGERQGRAKPGTAAQARFLRHFLPAAAALDLDYFIVEAFDQPWKRAMEGEVGGHWGIFDFHRQAKFPWSGEIRENAIWPYQFAFSLAALLLVAVYLRRRQEQPFPSKLMFALLAQTVFSVLAWTGGAPWTHNLLPGELLAWACLLPFQAGLLLVVLLNGFELAEMYRPRFKRRFLPVGGSPAGALPKVSIHVAACREPSGMVIATLDSLAGLDYPNFEVIVVDNNTPDPRLWEPVQAHCAALGDRFRFFHLEKWPGFKAGALNFALTHTAPDAEIIGVVDSDYLVRPEWLAAMVPHFREAEVGFVQAPQDHREWKGSSFKEMCNWEYQGFFDIGMVYRNEGNAIIQHGTMTLIRRIVLQEVGGWGEWCICEDAELGLRILEKGYQSVYVNQSFGRGLTPDSFAGYKRQRFRWAYGAVQILRHHWRQLLPWNKASRLTPVQRYHFGAGWLPWFADSLNWAMTTMNLLWATGMLLFPRIVGTPLMVFLLPPLGAFAFKLFHVLVLYKARVRCSPVQRLGAALAGMALVHTIGRAMVAGLFTSGKPFFRTPKCEGRRPLLQGLAMADEEIFMLVALMMAALSLVAVHGVENPDILLWAGVLVVQALPYGAALALSLASIAPASLPDRQPHPVWRFWLAWGTRNPPPASPN
jgi:exo-beta-1,3-glucanase (GH17 family)/cellulose synthase/poly-beta-1,6-N-acetylglucosamine synthase-like glycosyltransferase